MNHDAYLGSCLLIIHVVIVIVFICTHITHNNGQMDIQCRSTVAWMNGHSRSFKVVPL